MSILIRSRYLNFKSLFSYMKLVSGQKGNIWVYRAALYHLFYFIYYKKIRQNNTSFTFLNQKYNYFYSLYNSTYYNERCVEIPIVMEVVNKYMGKKILEVGNVLSHYFDFEHDIIDKYEIAKKVINQDVVDFKPKEKYDLIVSISTLEHVGWDENPKDDMKILHAIENLKHIIRPDGIIFVTLPVGQNPVLDKLLSEGGIRFTKQYYLMRITKSNEWKEVSYRDVQYARLNKPFPGVNALVVGIISS